jgi:hypothetical protein
MIGSIFDRIVMVLTMAGVLAFGYVGYQAYSAVKTKLDAVGKWISKIDGLLGDQERRFGIFDRRQKEFESRIRGLGEMRVGRDADSPKSDPVQPAIEAEKPTVWLYSIEGCTPCEQWWISEASKWIAAGWEVKRKMSTSNRPTPYWRVWDGVKWMEFDRTLNMQTYKKAGGL